MITRNFGNSPSDQQTYLPSRFLRGLLPDALVDDYTFWQNDDDSIVGYHLPEIQQKTQIAYVLRITLIRTASTKASARVVRIPIKQAAGSADLRLATAELQWMQERSISADPPDAMTLLNLVHTAEHSALMQLSDFLIGLDSLSHCLVWTKSKLPKKTKDIATCTLDVIELPRLQVNFSAKRDNDGTLRLYSSSHAGMHISSTRNPSLIRLLRGMPHGIVLENADGNLAVLTPASLPVRKPTKEWNHLTTALIFNHNEDHIRLKDLSVRQYLYPVHISSMFLFTPTLASALNLLLLRFLNLQYGEVFQLADCCVSDTNLFPDESLIFEQLKLLSNDVSPDAHACRLKISLVTVNSDLKCPWDPSIEMLQYVSKLSAVSANCRLSIDQELFLLQNLVDTSLNYKLSNRQQYLRALSDCTGVMLIAYPSRPTLEQEFDKVVDKTCLSADQESFLGKFENINYRRPPELNGLGAVTLINKWMTNGIRLKGGSDDLGFLFYYEMMTGALNFRILSTDSAHNLAALLLRFLPPKDTQNASFLMSVLRVFARNPSICMGYSAADCPKVPTVETSMFKMMFKGMDNPFSRTCKEVQPYLIRKQALINWNHPDYLKKDHLPASATVSSEPPFPRTLITTNVANFSCSVRLLRPLKVGKTGSKGPSFGTSQDDVKIFSSRPLEPLGLDDYLLSQNRQQQGLDPVSSEMPFDLKGHPAARSHIAKAMLARLEDDAAYYAEQANSGKQLKLKGLLESDIASFVENPASAALATSIGKMDTLIEGLRALQTRDKGYMQEMIDFLLTTANRVRRGEPGAAGAAEAVQFELARRGRAESVLELDHLVTSLMCTEAEQDLALWNPFLNRQEAADVLGLCVDLMLHVVRIGHAARCLADARDLRACLAGLAAMSREEAQAAPAIQQELLLKSNLVATGIALRRSYTFQPSDAAAFGPMAARVGYQGISDPAGGAYAGGAVVFDPRFLVFEFIHNVMLRDQQVQLVQEFMSAFADPARGSTCQQLIMGAGKTTVVCPLLALMLADGARLVMQVVPRALLEFSRCEPASRPAGALRRCVRDEERPLRGRRPWPWP